LGEERRRGFKAGEGGGKRKRLHSDPHSPYSSLPYTPFSYFRPKIQEVLIAIKVRSAKVNYSYHVCCYEERVYRVTYEELVYSCINKDTVI
jgi:hypothetical protein